MARFVLTENTQLVREMEVHEAAKAMAADLGIVGQVETRVGDFEQKGWTTGWVGKRSDRDVLLEVYVAPLHPLTLSMATENLVLREALERAGGEGASERAIEEYRAMLAELDRKMAAAAG